MPSQQRDSTNDSNLSRETQLYTVGSLLVALFGVAVLALGFTVYPPVIPLGMGLGGAAVALGATHLRRALSATDDERVQSAPDRDPVAVLKERYAHGDVDDDEFERRLARLLEVDSNDGDEPRSGRRDDVRMRER